MTSEEEKLILVKQIEVLLELPYKTIAISDSEALFAQQRTIIAHEDFLKVLNDKRRKLKELKQHKNL